jgi:WD40 repeat protein
VKVWEPSRGQPLLTLDGPAAVVALASSPDGRLLVSAGSDGTVHIRQSASPEQPRSRAR